MYNDYREDMKVVRWTFWRVLGLVVVAVVVLSAVGFALHSFGVFGQTIVERKVFENSYQRTEALRSQIATDEAVLAEIEEKLRNPKLDEETRRNLEAQAAAARIRIRTAKRRLEQ
jgi:hypothetical protein